MGLDGQRGVAPLDLALNPLNQIQRTLHPARPKPTHMSINHGGRNIRMAEQLLNRPNVFTAFQQMRRKAMPKSVAGYFLQNTGTFHSYFHGGLNGVLIHVMPPQLHSIAIDDMFSAWFCVLAATFRSTAKCDKKAFTSGLLNCRGWIQAPFRSRW